jgi:hypothetical protein
MKTVYTYVAAAAAIVLLVVGIMLWYQTLGTASLEKTAQYQQSGLNQNPTQNAQNTPAPNSDNNKRTNENGFGDNDGDRSILV